MRALVVFESMYGNTRVIAGNIADGLRASHEVTVVPVAGATPELIATADLLVVGGPTHMHGMSNTASRRMAAETARKEGSGLTMDPDAGGPGLREWLTSIGDGHGLAAAFDTRVNGVPAFTGRAGRGIARQLRQHRYVLLTAPESFLIGKHNTLLDGEDSRARGWGSTLGTAASSAYASAHA
jgi:Flavodoxin